MKERSDESPHRDADGLHKRRGVWYYCLTIKGQRKFFSTRTSNYQKARTVRADAVKLQSEGKLPGDLSKAKFELALNEVLEGRKPHLAENTIRLEHERSGPLLKHFSGRRVSEIDATAIASYQAGRAKKVVSFRQACVRPDSPHCYVHSVAQETAEREPEKHTHS